jgi:hypothetical protein
MLEDLFLIVVKLVLGLLDAQALEKSCNLLDCDHLFIILGVWNALVELTALKSKLLLVTVFLLLD